MSRVIKCPGSFTHPNPERDMVTSAIFRADIEQALKAFYPSKSNVYGKVYVLLTSFSNTSYDEEIRSLAGVFRDIYHFSGETFEIPCNASAQRVLEDRIDKIVKSLNEHDLFIFYYGGHGCHDYDLGSWEKDRPLIISSTTLPVARTGDAPRYAWINMDSLLSKHKKVKGPPPRLGAQPFDLPGIPDILCILDCCYAGSEAIEGRFELLAACGIDRVTPGPGTTTSFTNNLVRALEELKGTPATVAQIHGKLMRKYYSRDLTTTPFHVELSGEMVEKGSIVLAPIIKGASSIPPHMRGVRPFVYSDGPPTVLLAVTLSDADAEPNAERWANWLATSTPPAFADMTIEILGFYKADCGVLTIALPIELWSVLRGRLAYKFLGYRAPNSLTGDLSVKGDRKENIPYRGKNSNQGGMMGRMIGESSGSSMRKR